MALHIVDFGDDCAVGAGERALDRGLRRRADLDQVPLAGLIDRECQRVRAFSVQFAPDDDLDFDYEDLEDGDGDAEDEDEDQVAALLGAIGLRMRLVHGSVVGRRPPMESPDCPIVGIGGASTRRTSAHASASYAHSTRSRFGGDSTHYRTVGSSVITRSASHAFVPAVRGAAGGVATSTARASW